MADEQQYCLRWNNFQANITSQFEALRDDEDFTDVTIACEGQKLQAHKVVLSACSPFFKELFKSNPCSHPIIFMRDVEAKHIVSLMEFMYAGEVNVAQAHLSAFLKTAESLKIRGLTDTSSVCDLKETEEDVLNTQLSSSKHNSETSSSGKTQQISSTSTVTSSQDFPINVTNDTQPPTKKQCKDQEIKQFREESLNINPFVIEQSEKLESFDVVDDNRNAIQPKLEIPDYLSDDDKEETLQNFLRNSEVAELTGGMEIIPQNTSLKFKEVNTEGTPSSHVKYRRDRNLDYWSPYDMDRLTSSPSLDITSRLNVDNNNHHHHHEKNSGRKNRLVKLGEGIEIYEDQLRSVKWSDYRKLTRGLATILFSPAELATCSVTGQRWSRAGSGERPVKPALDRAKVQAIICNDLAYVATRFPMVEISRIKQVLAYKCKENSTAFKMKAVRVYEEQNRENKS